MADFRYGFNLSLQRSQCLEFRSFYHLRMRNKLAIDKLHSEIEPYFEAFIRCQIFIRLFRREALISDYLILWMSAKSLSSVNLLAVNLTTWSKTLL